MSKRRTKKKGDPMALGAGDSPFDGGIGSGGNNGGDDSGGNAGGGGDDGGFRGRRVTTCSFCGKTSREVGP